MEANKQINEEQKLTDVVENKIIRLITANSMKPGDKLPNEYQLAQELGVGRNTLREAMTRLAARNLFRNNCNARNSFDRLYFRKRRQIGRASCRERV